MIDYDAIARLAFTHPANKGKSLRAIARMIGFNPGSLHRILLRLKLIPDPQQQHHNTIKATPSEPCCPLCYRCPETPDSTDIVKDLSSPTAPKNKFSVQRQHTATHLTLQEILDDMTIYNIKSGDDN